MRKFAFECFADGDIVTHLSHTLGVTFGRMHRSGQGDVVRVLLVEQVADIGMVDEDPGRAHHRKRDEAPAVRSSEGLEVRELHGRTLAILRPELEVCFVRAMNEVGLESKLPREPGRLQALLNTPGKEKHEVFRGELAQLSRASREKSVPTFLTELEDVVRSLV